MEHIEGVSVLATGKVRDIYAVNEHSLVLVTSNRISAFDVIMKNEVDQKGAILTSLSAFWFRSLQEQLPKLHTHFLHVGLPSNVAEKLPEVVSSRLSPRSMAVRRCEVFPIESIVRGYLTGSAWSSYQKEGTAHDIRLPEGLRESEKLERPLWTPSTKAEKGAKDENISPQKARKLIGEEYANEIETLSLQLYESASSYAASRGIIIADTKFEFGLDRSVSPPRVTLIDELLTPDSSRFWSAERYTVGKSQDSYDKQFLRDWLVRSGLKGQEDVVMPREIVDSTRERYLEAYRLLTGRTWEVLPP